MDPGLHRYRGHPGQATYNTPNRPQWLFLRRTRTRLLALVAILFLLHFLFFKTPSKTTQHPHQTPSLPSPHCPVSSLTSDILIVLRTGASETPTKLPVHLATTLRCLHPSNHVIYSDYEEDVQGYHVEDVLNEVRPELQDFLPEFELYKHYREHGRSGIDISSSRRGSGVTGEQSNPAWRLDRFKFLPMVERALRYQLGAKWFFFMELDGYVSWVNLLALLENLDPERPRYLGMDMYIGDVLFAHGGSGFLLSQAAVHAAAEQYRANQAAYDKYTTDHWAGDMVLGKVLSDAGIELEWAFPHFQGAPPSAFDFNSSHINRRPWCAPALTYHHMEPAEINAFWSFEMEWWKSRAGEGEGGDQESTSPAPLRHRDVFEFFIAPQLGARRDNWDNLSMDREHGIKHSFDSCRKICVDRPQCMQFAWFNGQCATSKNVKLGDQAKSKCLQYDGSANKCTTFESGGKKRGSTMVSGWMVERLGEYIARMDEECEKGKGNGWFVV